MKIVCILTGLALFATAVPASAGHIANLNTPFESRGACESATADFDSDDAEMLLELFPNFFYNRGDVTSFLKRAFTCELDAADAQWYIEDHRSAVLGSDWYLKRHD